MINYTKLFSLKGKTMFLAGGSGLLGAEIARAAASMGAKVIILDLNLKAGVKLEQDIRRKKGKAHFAFFDLSDLDNANSNLDKIARRYGVPHIWVNASYPRTKDWALPLEKMDLSYLRKNIDMHLNSCLWTSRYIALMMKKARIKGSMVHFGSIYGVRANDLSIYEGTSMSGEMLYCAMKAGISNMSRYLASYFGKDGIRANTICPGGVFDNQHKTFVGNYTRRVPLKAMARPAQVAAAVLFLSAAASDYITGHDLMVDGGWTAV